jgi:hypothetical protein
MLRGLDNLSRVIHDLIYDDATMSLCARAYDKQDVSTFWWLWVKVFDFVWYICGQGSDHCRASWLYHCEQSYFMLDSQKNL